MAEKVPASQFKTRSLLFLARRPRLIAHKIPLLLRNQE